MIRHQGNISRNIRTILTERVLNIWNHIPEEIMGSHMIKATQNVLETGVIAA